MAGAARVAAQGLPPAEKAFFDSHIAEFVQIVPTRLSDPALRKVFATPLYDVQVVLKEADGESRNGMILARVGDRLVPVSRPGTDQDFPELVRMVDPAFRLDSVEAGATFQRALDLAFPILGSSDQKAKTFLQEGHRWVFIRGVFFKTRTGFVLETDDGGGIRSAKFSLGLP
jgi:hypothetical protein